MKIEVGESLACSYLCHVKCCWIVQANWKASGRWDERQNADLEVRYLEMKRRFDPEGSVLKQPAAQFLKQGEIDVVGVDQRGEIHAMEVAFHKANLNYSRSTTIDNVLKKMLRALFILRTYHSSQTPIHIYFLSPKAPPKVLQALKTRIAALQEECDEVDNVEWSLLSNDDFAKSIVEPTLANASGADTSELFVRSVKLLETAGYRLEPPDVTVPTRPGLPEPEVKVQCLVRALMRTILTASPSLLSDAEREGLTGEEYCKTKMKLQISNLGLIRKRELGREIKGHTRYWKDAYGGFYVCSQWSRRYRCVNARSLLTFVKDLIQRNPGHKDTLHPHAEAFNEYLVRNCPNQAP